MSLGEISSIPVNTELVLIARIVARNSACSTGFTPAALERWPGEELERLGDIDIASCGLRTGLVGERLCRGADLLVEGGAIRA